MINAACFRRYESRRLLLCDFAGGELREQHGDEDEDAAADFAGVHRFAEDEPRAYGAEDRLHAELRLAGCL